MSSNECNAINCLIAKTNALEKNINKKRIKVKKITPEGKFPTIGDKDHKFSEIWTEELFVDNSTIHFSNGVDLKTNNDGCLVTTTPAGNVRVICSGGGGGGGTGPTGPMGSQGSQGIPGVKGSSGPTGPMGSQGSQGIPGVKGSSGPTGPAYKSITILKGNKVIGTITKPGLVLLESTDSTYNIADTGNIGDSIKIIRSKNNEGWEAVVNTSNGYPNGSVYQMFRDGATGPLYIGGDWSNNLNNVPNTQRIARLPANKVFAGSTGPWEAVVNTSDGYPNGPVHTMFRDGATGPLYIGGYWSNDLNGVMHARILARLPANKLFSGSVGPWEPVVNTSNGYPNGTVYTIFRDGATGPLYIGGDWSNDLNDVPNTQRIARLPANKVFAGSTGPWEAVVNTSDGYPNGPVHTMFRDGATGPLYIGGYWSNDLNGVSNTQHIARLPADKLVPGSTGPWEAVVNTSDGYPDGTVFTIFRDGATGPLYIGGKWSNFLNQNPFTQKIARLPADKLVPGSTGPWEAVVNTSDGYPDGRVYQMFRDGATGPLYIGGYWSNDLNNVPNTQRIARLPANKVFAGSTGPWEAVVNTSDGYPNGPVHTMFRDGATGPLYIGGGWNNDLNVVMHTQSLARFQYNPTTIIANNLKYNIPVIGNTLEFTYTSPSWIKSTYI